MLERLEKSIGYLFSKIGDLTPTRIPVDDMPETDAAGIPGVDALKRQREANDRLFGGPANERDPLSWDR